MGVSDQQRGRLIVLEGVDGSGKTTTGREVAAALGDLSCSFMLYKEISSTTPEVETAMRQLAQILWPSDQTQLRNLPSRYRVILHAAWASLLSEGVIERRLAQGDNFLLDGWCFKIMGRFLVDGYDREYLNVLFDRVTRPDQVICLDPDIESVWARGQKNDRRFSPVEMGLYQGYAQLGKDTFVSYQSRSRDALLSFAREQNGKVALIRTNGSISETVASVETTIRSFLTKDSSDQHA